MRQKLKFMLTTLSKKCSTFNTSRRENLLTQSFYFQLLSFWPLFRSNFIDPTALISERNGISEKPCTIREINHRSRDHGLRSLTRATRQRRLAEIRQTEAFFQFSSAREAGTFVTFAILHDDHREEYGEVFGRDRA